jgi:hypothetical protein
MEYMHELKDMLCEELEQIAEKGELTAGSLDTIDKLTHSIKSIATIMAMEGSDYSYDYGGNMGGSYRDGNYARRDSRGRYSRRGSYARNGMRGGYSRDDEMDKMVAKLEKMMDEASDQNVKHAIEQAINAIGM